MNSDKAFKKVFKEWCAGEGGKIFDCPEDNVDICRYFWDAAIDYAEQDLFKDFNKDSPLWGRIFDAIKTTGNFLDALSYMEESLTGFQYEILDQFFGYLLTNNLTIGHGNYMEHFNNFLDEVV